MGIDARMAGSAFRETLTSMLATLHARIWQWRSLGLTHPHRSGKRSRESIENLRSIVTAAESRDADAAERATRHEANQAAQEVMRLLSADLSGNDRSTNRRNAP